MERISDLPATQRRNPERDGRNQIIEILSHPPGFDFPQKFAARTTKEAACLRLLGVKIGVDDQFLQCKAQIPDFRQIDRSLGGKGGEYGLASASALESRINACGTDATGRGFGRQSSAFRLHARPRSGPGSRFRQCGQSRAESAPRWANCLARANAFVCRFAFWMVATACHEDPGSTLCFSNAGSKPGTGRGIGFPCGIFALGALLREEVA